MPTAFCIYEFFSFRSLRHCAARVKVSVSGSGSHSATSHSVPFIRQNSKMSASGVSSLSEPSRSLKPFFSGIRLNMDEFCRSSRLFKRIRRIAAALNAVAGVQLHNKLRAFRKQDRIGRFSVLITILKFMRMRMIAYAEALLFCLFNYAVDFLRMTVPHGGAVLRLCVPDIPWAAQRRNYKEGISKCFMVAKRFCNCFGLQISPFHMPAADGI